MRLANWLSWVLGTAVLAGVVVAALHFSEEREFARLAERAQAKPGWLLVAFMLQAATYSAQAEVFRRAPERAGLSLPKGWLYQLSLAKLFVDQALPSAGISSAAAGASRPSALSCRSVAPGVDRLGAHLHLAAISDRRFGEPQVGWIRKKDVLAWTDGEIAVSRHWLQLKKDLHEDLGPLWVQNRPNTG